MERAVPNLPLKSALLALAVAGCSRGELPAAAASFAGAWQVRSQRTSGDTVVGYRLTATSDTSGWTLQFPGREELRVRVVVAGDSAIGEVEPYQSVLRPGVAVRTRFVLRLRNDSLTGTTIARYPASGQDSVLHLRNVGLRVP